MRVFQLFKAADLFMKRLQQVEDSMEDLRRQVRNQDLDVSDALEKMQKLNARLAKRAERVEVNHPSPGDGTPARRDPISERILLERRGVPRLPTED